MRELGSRISSEITDATGAIINCLNQCIGSDRLPLSHAFSMGPVLAEKAVKGTAVIENGQILKSIFGSGSVSEPGISGSCSARADPIGHTVRGKSIMIPAHNSFFRRGPLKLTFPLSPQATIPPTPFWNPAPIDTDPAEDAGFVAGRMVNQVKGLPGKKVGIFNRGPNSSSSFPEAFQTDRKSLG
jgi:hypothetical protein